MCMGVGEEAERHVACWVTWHVGERGHVRADEVARRWQGEVYSMEKREAGVNHAVKQASGVRARDVIDADWSQ